jgi:hypothetical protein
MRISLFNNITSTTPKIASTDVFKVLDSIKDGTYRNQIAKLRVENDKETRSKLKANLNYVTFAGTFSTRSNANLKQHSGLACLDFDNVGDLDGLIKHVNGDEFTFSSFISPSGTGLKVLIKIPLVDNNDDYQDYYIELIKHYSMYFELDNSTKDIARACFLSYDEDLYLNVNSRTFTDKYNKPLPVKKEIINIPILDKDEIAERLDKWFKKRFVGVNRNNNLHAYARQMNCFGVDKATCEQYLFRYEMPGFKNKEIQQLINSAYNYTNEFGTLSFEDAQKVKDIKNLVFAGQTIDKIKDKVKDVEDHLLKQEIEKHSQNLRNDEFWFYTENDAIRLATFRFLNYLESNNISKYYPDSESDTYLFIKKEDNFVADFGESKIKDFTLTDLRDRGQIDAFELMANNSNNFSSKYLSMIKTTDVKINKDTKDASFIYYQNFAVKTTKDGSNIMDYKEIDDLIWKNQVIDRDITLSDKSGGEFKTFIWRLSGEDKERYYTLKSVIGYLMHSYQNESKPKAIIFNDEMISEDIPNGGSGKGLIHKAIGHIKNIVIEDGKKFDPKGQFAYQKVNKDTQIFLMDDVPKHFSFESLFSIVTEGMTVEKKGKDAFQIPFKESPKISITTNYTVQGDGASHYRRVFEVEIANHFNNNYTPEDEFHHQFFSEWSKEEWAEFDNFMIRCVQFFLKNGLVESNKVNLELRKLRNSLGNEFIEFMESQHFDGSPINRKDFRDKFNSQYPTIARFNSAQRFNKKVKDYCDFNEIKFSDRKFNGISNFYIG